MELSERVDAAIDAALGSRIVGCVVLVNQDGRTVFARAAGFADREAGILTRQDTIFRLASVTKPLVATAILRLADEGTITLDDPVTKYLPFFTPKAPDGSTPTITIRHLLTHTSGLSYSNVPANVSRGSDPRDVIPLEENLRRLGQNPLSFAPGTDWQYGMSIDVLGGVVGALSGDISDVEAGLQRWVTGPLGMTDTHFYVSDPARLAVAYGDGSPPFRMTDPQPMVSPFDGSISMMSPGRIFERRAPQSGGSGMAGTAGDFMKLLDAVVVGNILRSATRDAAFRNQVGLFTTGRRNGEQFGFLGAVITDATAAGWPRDGMLRWGGIWGNNWAVDPATRTSLVVFTNTMWEGSDGPFRNEMRDAVFA